MTLKPSEKTLLQKQDIGEEGFALQVGCLLRNYSKHCSF